MLKRYLRRVAGITRKRKQTLKTHKVQPLTEVADKNKMRRFDHLVRMKDQRIAK